MFPKFTACKRRCPSLKLVVQFNSWPYNPNEEGRRHMETIKSFLLALRESQSLLSPNRNISQDLNTLNDEILNFLQRIVADSVPAQEQLNATFKHHLLLSQEHGLFQYFLSPPGSAVDAQPSLTTCHVNTVLVMSYLYHCHVMGCLPQPIAISKRDSLFSVVYTSGSTGFAKGTHNYLLCMYCTYKYVCMYAYIRTYVHTVHTYMHAYIHTYIHTLYLFLLLTKIYKNISYVYVCTML